MKKLRKTLGLLAALGLVLAMGMVVYAENYSGSVFVKDIHTKKNAGIEVILEAGTVLEGVTGNYYSADNARIYEVKLDGQEDDDATLYAYTVKSRCKVVVCDRSNTGSGYYTYKLELETVAEDETKETGEQKLSAEEKWKNSPQNPDNYLPKQTLADGTEVRAAFPAHYKAGKEDSVSAVVTTMEDFCRTLGITGGKTVHMNSFHSLCGDKMKQLMADHAALLGEQCSAEVTLGEIIELETEVRDSDYNLLGLAEESAQPVQITICLTGKLKELSDTMDFAVVMWTEGEVAILKDVDEEPFTITIETTKTNGVMGIVYAPKGSFAGLE